MTEIPELTCVCGAPVRAVTSESDRGISQTWGSRTYREIPVTFECTGKATVPDFLEFSPGPHRREVWMEYEEAMSLMRRISGVFDAARSSGLPEQPA